MKRGRFCLKNYVKKAIKNGYFWIFSATFSIWKGQGVKSPPLFHVYATAVTNKERKKRQKPIFRALSNCVRIFPAAKLEMGIKYWVNCWDLGVGSSVVCAQPAARARDSREARRDTNAHDIDTKKVGFRLSATVSPPSERKGVDSPIIYCIVCTCGACVLRITAARRGALRWISFAFSPVRLPSSSFHIRFYRLNVRVPNEDEFFLLEIPR